mgnify:CR=1 FL=1
MKVVCFLNKQCKQHYVALGLIVLSILMGLFAYRDYLDEKELAGSVGPVIEPQGEISLVIDTQKRILVVHNDGLPYKQYRVAVGKSETPTPVGEWKVVWKDCSWGTGFGSRWMGLNVPWGTYGIHGTNKPWSIGRHASHGCIRMHNKSVEELFEWVPIGTPVKILGRAVNIRRNLKCNVSGPDVVILQQKLREVGVYSGRADGIFGVSTEEAVKTFQANSELPVTGIVNKETRKALGFAE